MMSDEREQEHPDVRLERQGRLLEGETMGELRALTDAQLVEKHDAFVAEARRTNKVGAKPQWLDRAQVYADELARRQAFRQGKRMEALTESLNRLTWWIAALTVVGVLVAGAGAAVAILTYVYG